MENINGNYSNSENATALGTVNTSDMGQIFSYNGNSVRMRKMNGYILVCLTDFAKPFPDKNLSTIINSKELTDYVGRLSEIKNFSSLDLLQVTRGNHSDGREQGTWAHQKVAIRVAQKLSTDFAIWVDDKIEELLRYGMTATQPTLEQMINNPDLIISLATRLKSERQEKERLMIENKEKQSLIEQKDEQLDESKEWYSIKRWAKEHHMNWRSISWRKMKALSFELGYEIKKVFDANYGQVNIYNIKVFEAYI